MQPNELLDLIKLALGVETDYQLSKKLKLSTSCVSSWRKNTNYPKNSQLIEFAKILGMNAGILMIYSLEWREKDAEAKAQLGTLINAIHHAKFDDSFINSHA